MIEGIVLEDTSLNKTLEIKFFSKEEYIVFWAPMFIPILTISIGGGCVTPFPIMFFSTTPSFIFWFRFFWSGFCTIFSFGFFCSGFSTIFSFGFFWFVFLFWFCRFWSCFLFNNSFLVLSGTFDDIFIYLFLWLND